jgi:hypothetical protein
MTKHVFAASYERSIELTEVGCPLDYPNALPRRSATRRMPFRIQQLAGYAESRVYPLGAARAGYVIVVRLWTNVPGGTVITKWDIVPPWQDHQVDWDYEPEDIIPKGDRAAYMDVLDSRLMAVLNDRHLLRRGYPIDGLVCGYARQPIPESCQGAVSAKLVLVDDAGNTVALPIRLAVFGSAAIRSNALPRRATKLFKGYTSLPSVHVDEESLR